MVLAPTPGSWDVWKGNVLPGRHSPVWWWCGEGQEEAEPDSPWELEQQHCYVLLNTGVVRTTRCSEGGGCKPWWLEFGEGSP